MEPQVKLKLVIAYHGAAYAGWQVQKSGLGVQEVINRALAKLFQHPGVLHGSSRTDQGVHARGMVAHFEVPKEEWRMTPKKLVLALNAHLPEDIRVMEAKRAHPDFNARFDATGKEYRYYVWCHSSMNPMLRDRAWHVTKPVDILKVQQAARQLIGTRDFKAFANNRGYEMKSTVRTIQMLKIQKSGPLWTFIIRGDGFLYKMCRGIVGTLVQVGQGKLDPDEMTKILETRDRRVAGMTAPAHGLILWKVFYERGTGGA